MFGEIFIKFYKYLFEKKIHKVDQKIIHILSVQKNIQKMELKLAPSDSTSQELSFDIYFY